MANGKGGDGKDKKRPPPRVIKEGRVGLGSKPPGKIYRGITVTDTVRPPPPPRDPKH